MQHGGNMTRTTLSKRLVMSGCAWVRYLAARNFNTGLGMLRQTHYETLGLEKNCTASDIRQSFIKLSKELHPDTNPLSPELHKRFVAVNEAYSVLSKPLQRHNYDAQLAIQERMDMHTNGDIRTNAPNHRVVYQDPTLWENRDRSQDYQYEQRPYYGVKGIKRKLPNSYIAAGAFIFMVVGAVFHFFLAKITSDFAIEQLNLRDQKASKHLQLVRERAMANSKEVQIDLIRQRILDDRNK